jgi:hypothetical protein
MVGAADRHPGDQRKFFSIAAAAFGMRAFGIAFQFVEHGV